MRKGLLILMILCLCGCSDVKKGVVQDGLQHNTENFKENIEVEVKSEREEIIQFIKDSMVFNKYCDNDEIIAYDEFDGFYHIKAQPKDIPTISVRRNEDGTFFAERNYIVTEQFTYEKNDETRRAELTITVFLNQGKIHYVDCHLYAADAEPSNYSFYYEPKGKYIYKNGKDDVMVFTEDLQKKIELTCESVMKEIERLDIKVVTLMEQILQKKGFENIKWIELSADEGFMLNECDAVYPLMRRYNENAVYSVMENLYVVERDGFYGILNKDRELLVEFISETVPIADGPDEEIHFHIQSLGNLSIQDKIAGTSYVVCTGEHGLSGFGYVSDSENQQLKKYILPDGGPRNSVSVDLSFMGNLAGVYEEGFDFEYHEEYGFEDFTTTGYYGVFNVNGLVTSAAYSEALLTIGELVPVADAYRRWGYVDVNGNEVIPCAYEASLKFGNTVSAWPVINNSVILKDAQTGFYGVKDLQGNTIVDFTYDFIGWIDENRMIAKENDVWYVKTADGWEINSD